MKIAIENGWMKRKEEARTKEEDIREGVKKILIIYLEFSTDWGGYPASV